MHDTLTLKEIEYCRKLLEGVDSLKIQGIDSLKKKVLARLEQNNSENESLFELRVAASIKSEAQNIKYEHPAISGSTVDFYCERDGHNYYIELVSIRTSDAVKDATISSSPYKGIEMFETILTSSNQDQRQTTGGEIVKAQEKIGEKVWDGQKCIKFNSPGVNDVNIIVVDMRGFNLGVMDHDDYKQICFSRTKHFPEEGFTGNKIIGLFDPRLNKKYAIKVREKLHFIVFTKNEAEPFSGCFVARNDVLVNDRSIPLPFEGVL